MSKNHMPPSGFRAFLGVDPGNEGAIALVDSTRVVTQKIAKASVHQLARFIKDCSLLNCRAVIEQIIPRPTAWFDRKAGKFVSSILKSTCLLYGSFRELRAMLVDIPFEEVTPQKWLDFYDMHKEKGEEKRAWKNRLKALAQKLFPKITVTLATADALLIANYNRVTNSY